MSKAKAGQPIKARGNTLYFSFSHKGKKIRSATGYKVGQEDLAYAAYLQKRKELEDEDNGIQTHRNIQDGLIRWIEEKQPTLSAPEKYNTHINVIREFIDETKPLTEIYQVTNKMVLDMQQALKLDKDTGEMVLRYKNSSINRKSAILSGIATLSYSRWKWLAESPYKKITQLSESKSERDTFVETGEVEELAAACKLEATRKLVLFAAYTGIRTAELWRLNENSLRGNEIYVDGKGHKLRVVPLNDQYLIDYAKELFPLKQSEGYIKADFLHARKECNMLQHTFHDLRHTFGTLMAKAGEQQYKIMKLMGHSSDQMARRYMKLHTNDLRDSMPKRPLPPTKKPELRVVS